MLLSQQGGEYKKLIHMISFIKNIWAQKDDIDIQMCQ